MKIVINSVFGGFGLSVAGIKRYAELTGHNVIEADRYSSWKLLFLHPTYSGEYTDMTDVDKEGLIASSDIPRDDPALVQVVEELGGMADGSSASLRIVEIPDDVDWIIQDYDGSEWIAERHRTWGYGILP